MIILDGAGVAVVVAIVVMVGIDGDPLVAAGDQFWRRVICGVARTQIFPRIAAPAVGIVAVVDTAGETQGTGGYGDTRQWCLPLAES